MESNYHRVCLRLAPIAVAVNADADGVGFRGAFSNDEHGIDFHLFRALYFAVDLVS